MATHSPMDTLHEHLDRAAGHAAQVHADATEAAAAHEQQRQREHQNVIRETLTENGG